MASFFETAGIDRLRKPAFRVTVRRDGFFTAAEFFLGFGGLVFLPLVHFHGTIQFDRVDGNCRENRVSEDFFRFHLAGHIDGLSIIVGVDRIGTCRDASLGGSCQVLVAVKSTSFIPEQKSDCSDDEHQTGYDPFKGIADARSPGGGSCFSDGH